ncbi:peptidoglycan-binding domain-containing protein [Micromonosporaceae bacterium B7E4]
MTRQTLADRQTQAGTWGYGKATILPGRLTGTVTALAATGSAVKRGQAIYRVDNTPVVLLYGSLPAYRALATGTKGPDVEQFEQNLKALGYSGFTVDETYSTSTAAAVKEWQDDLDLPKTGTVDFGRVVYASGIVRVDAQKVAVGDAAQPATAVLTYTGTSRVVTVDLKVDDARLARKSAKVEVISPDGKKGAGKIAEVKTIVKPAEGEKPATTEIEVTVVVDNPKALTGLDRASVTVGFTASERRDVLTVPVAALLALAEGGYGVQVVDGTSTRILAVQTGLFADGRVEVTGTGLVEGMVVGVPA